MRHATILTALMLGLALGGVSLPASAALLNTYSFTGHALTPTDADGTDGITFSDIVVGTGYGDLTDNGALANALRISGDDTENTTGAAFTNDAFLSFTITVGAGSLLDLTSIEVDNQATNAFSYSNARVFSDVQGFDAVVDDTIGVVGRGSSGTDGSIETDLIDLDDPTNNPNNGANATSGSDFILMGATQITFFLPWIDNSSSDTRFTDLHEIRINGAATSTVPPVPEPATVIIATLGLLGMALLGWRRRKR